MCNQKFITVKQLFCLSTLWISGGIQFMMSFPINKAVNDDERRFNVKFNQNDGVRKQTYFYDLRGQMFRKGKI